MKKFIGIAGVSLFLAASASAQNNYAGIYHCDLSGDYYNSLAVIVRTNNQATLVGSAFGTSNSIGLFAQFKVQTDGTWSYQTNGFSGHGQVFADGTITGELDSAGGGVSTLDNGTLQSDSGPFQGQAGFYDGMWWGGGENGKLFGILSALGELTYCAISHNQPVDGGGPDSLDEFSRSFSSFTVNNAELDGTLTNATLTIGGSVTSPVSVVGGFRMTRTSFVPRKLPPTITSAPQNRTVTYGGSATFSVTATGTGPLHYQWYSNIVALPGATTRTLVVNNVQPEADGTIYTIVITNLVGETNAEVVLTAVPETKPPTVSIVSPVAGQRVSDALFSASGHAADNNELDSVWYQLNGGAWANASGTSNWSANLGLVAGTNVLAAYAMDTSGNLSPTRRVSFFFVVPSTLTLITSGLGSITHGFNGNVLEVGRTYAVTAVPGPGQVFSNWQGSVSSSSATLAFLMQSNMTLQANFIANPFLPAKGYFTGLFGQTNRTHARSGFFTLTLGDHGAYTAALKRGTNSYGFSGQFSVAGYASKSVNVGGSSWTVTMALDLGGAQKLSGTVGTGTWTADLLAHRAVFNALTNPAAQFTGRYTLIVPGNNNASVMPGGDGYGTLVVGPGGYATMNGGLADGFAWSESQPVSSAGDWAVYVPLYGGIGSIWGWLQFDTNHPAATALDGTLSWIRPVRPGATYYQAGFTNNDIAAGGSRYTAPTNPNPRVIALTNGVVFFEYGNLSVPFTNYVTLTSSNRVISTNLMSLGIALADGTFSGSVKVPGTTRTNTFKGALLQDANSGYGYFLGTNQSGRVFFGKH